MLLPIYLAVAAVIFTRSAPADTVQSGVPIAQPTLGDEKNFLLMTGPEQPETFVLLRFDALEGNLCSVAIPGETVVLVNGRPATLADAAEQAGPARKKQRAFRRTAERGRKMTPRDPLRPGRLAAQKLPVL